MKSIKELYKIGHGPSSSHTMGPAKACEAFKSRYPADHYRVILYGSLSLTGKGHLTDKVIKDTLNNVDIIFSSEFIEDHPNTMDLIAYKDQEEIGRERVYSIGGGTLRYHGKVFEETLHLYPHNTFEEIKHYCESEEIRLYEYVERFEDQDIFVFLQKIWDAMQDSIENGLTRD